MAQQKSKSKFSSTDVSDQSPLQSSLSDVSSESVPITSVEPHKPNSEVLKRHRHYQEFKRIYCSRLNQNKNKSKHGSRKHVDSHTGWNEAMNSFRRRDSLDKAPLPKMISSKVTHKRSERSYVEKLLNRFQKPVDSAKGSCESVKMMYSAFSSMESQQTKRPNSKYHHDYDKHRKSVEKPKKREKSEHDRDRYRERSNKEYNKHDKDINEIRDKHERPSHDRHRKYSEEEIDGNKVGRGYDRHRKQKFRNIDENDEEELSLEQEYYRKYHKRYDKEKGSNDVLPKHREYDRYTDPDEEYKEKRYKSEKYQKFRDYDDDKYEKKRKLYENYEKHKHRDLDEREKKYKPDKYYEDVEKINYHKRKGAADKNDKYEKKDKYKEHNKYDKHDKHEKRDKYDKYYKYEKECVKQRKYENEDDTDEDDSRHNLVKHQSRSKNSKYNDEDYEMIERLERYILEKRFGNYSKQKHYNDKENRRITSTERLLLENRGSSYSSQNEVHKRKSFEDSSDILLRNIEYELLSKLKEKSSSVEVIPPKLISGGYTNAEDEQSMNEDHVIEEEQEITDKQLLAHQQHQCAQKVLIERESQCAEVEKKSQASETRMCRRVSPLKYINPKPEKRQSIKYEATYSKSPLKTNLPDVVDRSGSANCIVATTIPARKNDISKVKKTQPRTKRELNEPSKLNTFKASFMKKGDKNKTLEKHEKGRSIKTTKENKKPTIKQAGKNNTVNIKEDKYFADVLGEVETSSSLLSTLSKMEERAIRTLQTLKEAEKKIIEERIGEITVPFNGKHLQEELEKHLKIIEEITKRQDYKKIAIKQTKPLTRKYKDEEITLRQGLMPINIEKFDKKYETKRNCKDPNLEEKERSKQKDEPFLHKIKEAGSKEDTSRSECPKQQEEMSVRKNKSEILLTGGDRQNRTNYKEENIIDKKLNLDFQRLIEERIKEAEIKKCDLKDIGKDANVISGSTDKTVCWKNGEQSDRRNVGKDQKCEKKIEFIDYHFTVEKQIRKEETAKSLLKDVRMNDTTISGSADKVCMREEQDPKYDKDIELKDTIREEDAGETKNSTYNEAMDKRWDCKESDIGQEPNKREEKVQSGGKEFIKEAVLSMKSDSSSAVMTSSTNSKQPTSFTSTDSITNRNFSRSRLPIRSDLKITPSWAITDVKPKRLLKTQSYHEQISLCTQKLLNIYRTSSHDNEELLEKLKRVINLQQTPGPSQQHMCSSSGSVSVSAIEKRTEPAIERENAFQKMKRIINEKTFLKCDKQKHEKRITKPQYSKKQKVNNEMKLSPEETTLQEAIKLFNIHKSTLSLVHGEISQLEQKIHVLLEKRSEKTNDKKSKIPKRIS